MLEDEIKVDSSMEGKITFSYIDEFEDKEITCEIQCDEPEKAVLLEQFDKLLADPKLVGLDFADCMLVFEHGCRFETQIFDLDKNVYKATAEWIKTLNIPVDVDVVIWVDGEPSMMQFNDIINGMYDTADLIGEAMVSYNGIPHDDDQIRISIWF